MAIAKQSGSAPFYKTGPLYAHGPNGTHPIDPKKEAKKKAETNASNARKVYGETSTKVEKLITPGGSIRGTKTTTTKPYTQSGTGSAEFNTAYRAAKKAKLSTFDYGGKSIKVEDAASKSGKDVTSTISLNKLASNSLKPMGISTTTQLPKADVKIKNIPSTPPKSSSVPSYSFSMKKQSGTKIIDKKVGGNKSNLRRPSKSSGGNSCGCK